MSDIRIENLSQAPVKKTEQAKQKAAADFSGALKGAIDRVNKLEKDSDKSVVEVLQGKGNIPETMIALQKADISMKLLLSVRNKVLEAYREIMHMQF